MTSPEDTVAPFTYRKIDVCQIAPETTEGPKGAAGNWKWTATVNGTVVRGSSVEDINRRIGSALDSDTQTASDAVEESAGC
jgi:hypothetical protein